MENQSEVAVKSRRCAIYVRKSWQPEFNRDFTSLEAQREVCSAYIASQQHRGWTEHTRVYEDSGMSGATLDRPAMQALLLAIESGQIDVVVTYKLDRLSRSLIDFIQLLQTFDLCGVSFVCVTQNFDTSDSLGRLVMNVLLTFAQFERELAADRIRDKKRLMTSKGMWSGGRPPLGYDLVEHRLVVNSAEADQVRWIFNRYLVLRSMKAVTRECRARGLPSKTRVLRNGTVDGGNLLALGSVRNLLCNPIYVGELRLKDGTCPGLQEPIISRATWNEACGIREAQAKRRVTDAPEDLLGGLVFDCFGRRMKANRRYLKSGWARIYISFQTEWARAQGLRRTTINAESFEKLILSSVHDVLADRAKLRSLLIHGDCSSLEEANAGPKISRCLQCLDHEDLRSALQAIIERIEVSPERIVMLLRTTDLLRILEWDGVTRFRRDPQHPRTSYASLDIACPGLVRLRQAMNKSDVPPFAGRRHPRLISLLRDARLAQSVADKHKGRTASELAPLINRSVRHFRRLLRLNYLAPDIVAAIRDGTQPKELRRKDLIEASLPLDWALQRRLLCFPEQGLTPISIADC